MTDFYPDRARTHRVFNQPPLLEDYSLFAHDTILRECLNAHGGDWALAEVADYGRLLGRRRWLDAGANANENPPTLRLFDRYGHRLDAVDYHPAYHELMALAQTNQLVSGPWQGQRRGRHLARMAKHFMHGQVEAGTLCPLTMSFAAIPVISKSRTQGERWLNKLLSNHYDPTDAPLEDKTGATLGMAMTEKQGGTDVRANTTRAEAVDANEEVFELTGHKWFCSAPMSDGFLTLAQTDAGLTCFLVPRWWDDGGKNPVEIQRLKDKMGNRSNASAEIEYRGARAHRQGEPGRGVATIIEMVALTRFDCMSGSAALMRQAVTQVCHHIHHRAVSGQPLAQWPLMQAVVSDLCLEVEGAIAMTTRLARALDQPGRARESALVRLLTAVGKYWVCKRASAVIGEAQECLGGIGYVEQSPMARLYREAPVNSIWEGSGNVQCLDALRTLTKAPEALEAFLDECRQARGRHPLFDAYLDGLESRCLEPIPERAARSLTEQLALAFQAAQLLLVAPLDLASAFCQSRLEPRGLCFGDFDGRIDSELILSRATPIV